MQEEICKHCINSHAAARHCVLSLPPGETFPHTGLQSPFFALSFFSLLNGRATALVDEMMGWRVSLEQHAQLCLQTCEGKTRRAELKSRAHWNGQRSIRLTECLHLGSKGQSVSLAAGLAGTQLPLIHNTHTQSVAKKWIEHRWNGEKKSRELDG